MDLLTPAQQTALQQTLERRRAELEAAAAGEPGGGAGELPVTDLEFSPADKATNRLLNDLALEVAGKHQEALAQVRGALGRLREGSYGLCEACGNPIGFARLQARPEAPLCIACQARAEKR
jgi:DnaK suppressor protein